MLSTAEVSDVSIENAGDSEKPLVYRCHVRVAAYAQRAGRRILFVPDVFRQNAKAVFTATTRKNPVYFPYAETEDDEVTIEIPSDFEFEVPRVRPPFVSVLWESTKCMRPFKAATSSCILAASSSRNPEVRACPLRTMGI